jgi:hypothetical protein
VKKPNPGQIPGKDNYQVTLSGPEAGTLAGRSSGTHRGGQQRRLAAAGTDRLEGDDAAVAYEQRVVEGVE